MAVRDDPPAPSPESAGFAAFAGSERIAQGSLIGVALVVHQAMSANPHGGVLVFDRATGKVVDLDLRGDAAAVTTRYTPEPAAKPGRGRPKLGVTAREVTLLPRHWDWLARQPGGASTTLRKLVEAAQRADAGATEARARTEAAYRFMSALAGDLPGFEEASRALFAGRLDDLQTRISAWPPHIRDEVLGFLGSPESAPKIIDRR